MPVKMIIINLDRTLMRTDKTISEFTANILGQCREKGVKVVFATARPKRAIDYLSCVSANAVIVHNGAIF